MAKVVQHGTTHRVRAAGGTDPIPGGTYEIKVFADPNALDGNLPASATDVSVGDGKFIFEIPDDLARSRLVSVMAFITTTGAANTIQIRNITQAVDMLTTPITIDAGDLSSFTAATPAVVNTANAVVEEADQISIDVDDAGGQGLGVKLTFA